MAVLSSAVSALSTFYQDSLIRSMPSRSTFDHSFDGETADHRRIRLQEVRINLPHPDNSYSFEDNFLRMTFGVRGTIRSEPHHLARTDQLLILLLTTSRTARRQRATRRVIARQLSTSTGWVNAFIHCTEELTRLCWRCSRTSTPPAEVSIASSARRIAELLMGFGHRVYKNATHARW